MTWRINMIENLNGIRETVNYRKDTRLRLYNNVQIEDYPDHWHTPVEIIMPIENIYSVVVGGHTITLNPTDIIFICPGVIHSLKAHGKGRRIIFQAGIPGVPLRKNISEGHEIVLALGGVDALGHGDQPDAPLP